MRVFVRILGRSSEDPLRVLVGTRRLLGRFSVGPRLLLGVFAKVSEVLVLGRWSCCKYYTTQIQHVDKFLVRQRNTSWSRVLLLALAIELPYMDIRRVVKDRKKTAFSHGASGWIIAPLLLM